MCIELLACGATRFESDVLHHTGFASSYTKVIRDPKDLSKARLVKIIELSHSSPFMIVCSSTSVRTTWSLLQVISLSSKRLFFGISKAYYSPLTQISKGSCATVSFSTSVQVIPYYQTKQYPLPAMHIDESSLDTTHDRVLPDLLVLYSVERSNCTRESGFETRQRGKKRLPKERP